MSRTNFSVPINVGRIQTNTVSDISENVRNVAFVECHASFPKGSAQQSHAAAIITTIFL